MIQLSNKKPDFVFEKKDACVHEDASCYVAMTDERRYNFLVKLSISCLLALISTPYHVDINFIIYRFYKCSVGAT